MEAHPLAGGNVARVVTALISADRANIELPWKRATAIDLAGRDVLEAVRVSVNPKVIQTPRVASVARDGIQVIAVARVTVRANIERLVGGRAGEETIIARVGEGTVSSIGSAASHKQVLENPDAISKFVLERGLDAGTAYEILFYRHRGRGRGAQHRGRAADRPSRGGQEDRPGQGRGGRQWPWPRSRRCAPASSRPRRKYPGPGGGLSAPGGSASWTTTAWRTSGRTRPCAGPRPRRRATGHRTPASHRNTGRAQPHTPAPGNRQPGGGRRGRRGGGRPPAPPRRRGVAHRGPPAGHPP